VSVVLTLRRSIAAGIAWSCGPPYRLFMARVLTTDAVDARERLDY
jgi:hypothetical protein